RRALVGADGRERHRVGRRQALAHGLQEVDRLGLELGFGLRGRRSGWRTLRLRNLRWFPRLLGVAGGGQEHSQREQRQPGECLSDHHITPPCRYSLPLFFRCASISRFSSSGVSFGRSIVSVSLSSVPVKRNGTW